MEKIEYIGRDYAGLTEFLNKHWGCDAEFSNGCSIYLTDDNGLLWGTTPYGQDWACNYREGWEGRVKAWLVYWDAPRDEWGHELPTGFRKCSGVMIDWSGCYEKIIKGNCHK